MDDRELEDRFMKLEKRVSLLEHERGLNGEVTSVIELDLTLPEADVDGLHFNSQQVRAVFEKKEDGWYHSRDILFLSARNTEDDSSRDILMKYLNSDAFRQEIRVNLPAICDIKVSLPKENEGIKKYNGVDWWYWRLPGLSTANFCFVSYYGNANTNVASAVGGCAPVFRVVNNGGRER